MNPEAATTEFLRSQSPPLQGTEFSAQAIARVNYTHDAMIDLIIANPMISQMEISKHFGYTPAWVSRIFNSDAFKARVAQRKHDLVDPSIALTIDEKLRAVADRSLDIVLDKLSLPTTSFTDALNAATLASKALGYGARQQNLSVQQNFVVALPSKAADSRSWAAQYNGGSADVIEQER